MKNIIYAVLSMYFSLIINVQANESNHKNTFSRTSIKTSKGTRINKQTNYFKTTQNKELSELKTQNSVVDRRGNRADYNGLLLGRAGGLMNESKASNTRAK
ncbi:MAG: hypothetical protein KAI70_05510 [Candidatus Omnitrophica bacterium]|nr:hypothetical protein [Candidatus Omnitrophota bacterium]